MAWSRALFFCALLLFGTPGCIPASIGEADKDPQTVKGQTQISASRASSAASGPDVSGPVFAPDVVKGAQLALVCAGCHSAKRTATSQQAIPSYAGFESERLVSALTRYQTEAGTTVMHRIMRGYSETDIANLSAYLASGVSDE